MNLAGFAINKRVISALATLLILAAGYFAYLKLPRFEDPEFIIRQAQVITPYTGASAEEVAEEVTDVVENALQQLQGVKEIKSVSTPGLSEITIEFTIAATKTRTALAQKFTQLRAKISDSQRYLPPNAGPASVYDDFGDVYALYYAITGEGYTLPEINEYAKDLQKELVLVDGVSKVLLAGAPQEIILVEYKPDQLAQLGLSSGRIAQLLENQNLVTSSGDVVVDDLRMTIRPDAAIGSLETIAALRIVDPNSGRSFRLDDIATVKRSYKEPVSKRFLANGKPAITFAVSNTTGGNVVNMGNAVKARIAELDSERPIGIEFTPISDQATAVKSSVDDFVMNVILALVIVIGTLILFMGIRSGVLMGGILLVTVAGTLFGMYLYGLDMQRISLGALIIALGMLVDNAIVVVEGTLVRTDKGQDPAEAAVAVVEQTKWPLLGGTVVGFLAFSAIGFSPDNTGEYAGSLFWTISIALLFSWLVAVWLTPYFCVLLLKAKEPTAEAKRENILLRAYRGFLKLAIKLRWITLALVIALFVSAMMNFGKVKSGFFPDSPRTQFVVDYTLPGNTDIERTTADIAEIEAWIRGLDGVTDTQAVIGSGHQRFMLTYSSESPASNYGQILVGVEDLSKTDALIPAIQSYLSENHPAASPKVWKFVLGPGGGSIIEARFFGPDATVLRGLSDQAKAIFAAEGAVSIQDDWRGKVQAIRPQINQDNARRVGLTQADISNAIAARFDGEAIGVFREGNELREIRFRPELAFRDSAERIRDVQVFSQTSGRYVPITQVVDGFDVVFEDRRIRKIDRALAITAQADPAPSINGGDLFEAVKSGVEAIPLPPGFSLEWKGQFGNSAEANAGLASTMPFGFGAMVIVVILLFNAIRQPLIIWLTVPLAVIGVVYGLIYTGTPMEFMAILGILSLTGMLIKNAIVLIDETDGQIASGVPRMTAIIDAAVSRVRPVFLGVLTTVLGVIPLLWDPFFKSLAVVIICGLSFATILTLIVVPTLYAVFFRVRGDEVPYVAPLEPPVEPDVPETFTLAPEAVPLVDTAPRS